MVGLQGIAAWGWTTASLLGVAVLVVWWYITKNDDYWKKRGVPYLPRPSVFEVIYSLLTKNLHDMVLENHLKYGKVHGGFERGDPIIVIGDPDVLRDVMVKQFYSFSTRRDMDLGNKVVNKMVSMVNGEEWKRIRSIITPAFTSKRMRRMTGMINECSDTLIATMNDHADKGILLNCKSVFGAFTMDVIARTAFAAKIDAHHDPLNPFVTHAKNTFTRLPILRMLLFFLMPEKLSRLLGLEVFDAKAMAFFGDVSLKVIEERKAKGIKGNDFLQLMMDSAEELAESDSDVTGFKTMNFVDDEEDQFGSLSFSRTQLEMKNRKLTQNETLAQCILFFIVGYETTAGTLAYIVYNLALNPECQEKLIQEVDEAFERNDEITYDVVRDMTYLDCIISETLRMYPPLPVSERTVTEDFEIESKGITVTKGMIVKIPIYALHYDPEYYPEPEKFIPERFNDENRKDRHQYVYLPFGAGPRNCLGMRFALMEIKLCLTNFLRHFRMRRAPETQVPLKFQHGMGFLTTDKILVQVERRT